MRNVSVCYTASARKDLKKLAPKVAKRIVTTVEKYSSVRPLEKAKALSGIFQGLYRYRIGDYRAVFTYDEDGELIILTILVIKHRKDIYR